MERNNMDNYSYPLGADDSFAPWNQKDEYTDKEVEVEVYLAFKSKIKVVVPEGADYKMIKDYVADQIELSRYDKPSPKGWNLDEFDIDVIND